jgi:hypothetical protein
VGKVASHFQQVAVLLLKVLAVAANTQSAQPAALERIDEN